MDLRIDGVLPWCYCIDRRERERGERKSEGRVDGCGDERIKSGNVSRRKIGTKVKRGNIVIDERQ